MKIGIITFHWAVNYGAVLQSYALQTFLQKKGHDVQIINYVPIGHKKNLLRALINPFSAARELKKFYKDKKLEKFRGKYLKRTKKYNTLNELRSSPPDFDVYICGSDQVWNPYFLMHGERGNKSPSYFLDFGTTSVKRIAYAVSFGCEKYEDNVHKFASEFIGAFVGIGVRENSGAKIVDELKYPKKAVVVPDPTLLLFKEDYCFNNRIATSINSEKKNVFSYFLRNEEKGFGEIMNYISSKYNVITNKESDYNTDGIENWIANISNSDLVITNSFHGAVFSMIFHRPFLVFIAKGRSSGMNDRFLTLLDNVGLKNRIVRDESIDGLQCILNTDIDWKDVDGKIAKLRETADSFFAEYQI